MYGCTFREVGECYNFCKTLQENPYNLCEYRVTVKKKKSKGRMIGGVGVVYVTEMKPVLSFSLAHLKIGLV